MTPKPILSLLPCHLTYTPCISKSSNLKSSQWSNHQIQHPFSRTHSLYLVAPQSTLLLVTTVSHQFRLSFKPVHSKFLLSLLCLCQSYFHIWICKNSFKFTFLALTSILKFVAAYNSYLKLNMYNVEFIYFLNQFDSQFTYFCQWDSFFLMIQCETLELCVAAFIPYQLINRSVNHHNQLSTLSRDGHHCPLQTLFAQV